MTLATLHAMLGWCTVINVAILMLWFAVTWLMPETMYRVYRRVFQITREQFDQVQLSGLTQYRLLILVFNLTPWLALHGVT
ncbi:MAG: hypothetical protein QNJ40_20400 [Xanthomonadales bacterium]|nr:hypothetical protein [Xanthomonadales bacterium]